MNYTKILAVLLVVHAVAVAGALDPALESMLQQTSAVEFVSVWARLNDRVPIEALDASLKQRKATRAERNYEVVTALQHKASTTQGALLSYLAQAKTLGLVREFESYWIDNMVKFTATPSVIREIAARPDIEVVFLEPEIFYDPPMDLSESTDRISSAENGLKAINAPALWRLGFAGQGRLVMNIDTGVLGSHVALSSRWRGTLPGVLPQYAWYGSGSSPSDGDGHGTHTMGIMTGLNAANQDTLGVAPGAYWIAGSSNYAGAFQWAVNPDGNPTTTDDVPDVINCSWFTSGDLCSGGFSYWSLMDNVEAAGAAVIWSAGNCGPGGASSSCTGGAVPGPYMTITPPKNRIASPVNAFAVGALDGNSAALTIASFSSRGPSACDTTVIKPEVSAPGVSVRSTYNTGSYANLSGTSMAAPHVAGAVALLRQINPNATVDELKYALYNTARDLGNPGEDNSYGMGIIDVFAAAGRISRYQVAGMVRSAGSLQPINLASVQVVQTEQRVETGTTGSYNIGPLSGTVDIRFSAFAHYDTTINVTVTPDVPLTLDVNMRPLPTVSISGTVTDSLSSQGIAARLSYYAEGDPTGGPTYTTTSTTAGSYQLSAITGTYRITVNPPTPYVDVVEQQNIVISAGGATMNYRLMTAQALIVDDDNGIALQTSYQSSLDRLGYRRKTVSIADSGGTLGAVLASFVQRPVLVWFTGQDSTNALTPQEKLLIIQHLNGGGRAVITGQNIAEFAVPGDTLLNHYLGIQFAGNSSAITVRGFAGDIIGNGINYLTIGGPGPQTSKDIINIVSGSTGVPTPTIYYSGPDSSNLAGVRVTGPGNLWAVAYFALGLDGFTAVRQDTLLARSLRYFDTVTGIDEHGAEGIPLVFTLDQNYPNPFNPITQIRYGLPQQSSVRITIYNVMGQEVARLYEGDQPAGYHSATWNGTNDAGVAASSGVYFYRLEATGTNRTHVIQSRKMILLK